MKGKFDSLRDQVIYRATLDGGYESLGDVETFGYYCLVPDFYGRDYILHEDNQGFITVDSYPIVDIYPEGSSPEPWQDIQDDYLKFQGVTEVWVCQDCYFDHHGLLEDDSRTVSEVAKFRALATMGDLSDWTDSNTGRGIDTFSHQDCDGCGSGLGGERHRLALWPQDDATEDTSTEVTPTEVTPTEVDLSDLAVSIYNGIITIATIVDGHRVQRRYQEWTLLEAIGLFREEFPSTTTTEEN